MHKLRKEKGITLIALIITIVVLLILAGVAIGTLEGSNIIGRAQEAASKYETQKEKENKVISDAESFLDQYTTGLGNEENMDIESAMVKFKENPEYFKHPEQSSSNGDRAIGTDGKAVNMDYWNYAIIDTTKKEIALHDDAGSQKYASYKGNIIDGKIIGTVPQYIKKAGDDAIYTVTSTEGCFRGLDLEIAPEIPKTVINTTKMFWYCEKLIEASEIPNGVTDCYSMYEGCKSLTKAPTIPNSVINARNMFYGCESLTVAPTILNGVTDASYMFASCTALTQAPIIPSSVNYMDEIFSNCNSLQGILRIEAANIDIAYSFIPWVTNITTIQVPADTITETSIRNVYGNSSTITIETF